MRHCFLNPASGQKAEQSTDSLPVATACHPPAPRSAFTLVELLIVIAIIAILASLLLPSLGQAKRAAGSAVCKSQLKQLAMAWIMYPEDHGGVLVPNYITGSSPNETSTQESWVTGNAKMTTTDTIRSGTLFRYVGETAVYRCPLDRYCWQTAGQTRQLLWNYGLSIVMHGGTDYGRGPALDSRVCVKISDVRHPVRQFTFIDKDALDAVQVGGAGTFFLSPSPGTEWYTLPGGRHGGQGASLAFADSHAEEHRWKSWPKHRGISTGLEDQQDLLWLQKRCTAIE